MLSFLTPDIFEGLIWAVILIGGAFAILRLLRDLTGPPRWPDNGEVPPGGSRPAPRGSSALDDPFGLDADKRSAGQDQKPPDA
jgi:hypothetical protein